MKWDKQYIIEENGKRILQAAHGKAFKSDGTKIPPYKFIVTYGCQCLQGTFFEVGGGLVQVVNPDIDIPVVMEKIGVEYTTYSKADIDEVQLISCGKDYDGADMYFITKKVNLNPKYKSLVDYAHALTFGVCLEYYNDELIEFWLL